MKPPPPLQPRRLDVRRMAEQQALLEGNEPLPTFERLLQDAPAPTGGLEPVRWRAQAHQKPVRGGSPEVWLHLQAQAQVPQVCQRCLDAMMVDLAVDRHFRFVSDEEQAETLDAEAEEDVLVLAPSMDLMALVEDELLLELPLVPRHEVCPQPLVPQAIEPEEPADEAPHPFAALARLKKPN